MKSREKAYCKSVSQRLSTPETAPTTWKMSAYPGAGSQTVRVTHLVGVGAVERVVVDLKMECTSFVMEFAVPKPAGDFRLLGVVGGLSPNLPPKRETAHHRAH